ncbi:MAG: phage integrase SAM-like domain-containing protein [Clostridia bacterium]|nr:phage integrase SAM-like domain-containing protein [Clostridia bacterium]
MKEAQKQAFLFEESVQSASESVIDSKTTFYQLSEEWFELVSKTGELKPSSIVRLKSCRERTYAALGDTPVCEISYRQIQKFILTLSENGVNQRTGKGLSVKSQKHYLTLISDVLKYARKCGIIQENPCKDISIVKTEVKERHPYTLEEEDCLAGYHAANELTAQISGFVPLHDLLRNAARRSARDRMERY